MPTVSTNTTISLPAGALLMFKAGGTGRAIDGAGNVYILGLNDIQVGPSPKAQTVQVLVTAGTLTYATEVDGSPANSVVYDAFDSEYKTPDGVERTSGDARQTIVVLGQSNEKGAVPYATYFSTSPQAFVSNKVPGFTSRVGNACFGPWQGSPWPKFFDDMIDHGYRFELINAAVGGLSFVDHVCGRVKTWAANSSGFYAQRVGGNILNPWDRGYLGDMIVESGKIFRCTTGTQIHISYQRPGFDSREAWGEVVSYITTSSPLSTAGTKPAGFATATLGQTVTDGSVVWTCVDPSNIIGLSGGQVLTKDFDGYGFDPFGILQAMDVEVCRTTRENRPWVLLCNGQSDTANAGAAYRNALTNITNWLLERGYRVAIGLSSFTNGGSTVSWNNLTTDVNTVLASFAGNADVKAGANLYTALGTSPGWQGDGVHLDGVWTINAGAAHAAAFKQILPLR